jgi:hypothetical protein
MKYDKPELTALTPAVNAIQNSEKVGSTTKDGINKEEVAGYVDWED